MDSSHLENALIDAIMDNNTESKKDDNTIKTRVEAEET